METIDLYYCHRRAPDVPIEDMVGAMTLLFKAGEVRQLGSSEVSSVTLHKANATHSISAVQNEYLLSAREPETDMLATCGELDTAFVAYSRWRRTFLAGVLEKANLAAYDFRKNLPRFTCAAEAANQVMVDCLSQFAKVKSRSNTQVSLAWLLCKHPRFVPIPGWRRIHHLEQNSSSADLELLPLEIAELDALFLTDTVAGKRYPKPGRVGINSRTWDVQDVSSCSKPVVNAFLMSCFS